MEVRLYKVSGYEEAIMSLRMSKGKYSDFDRAEAVQELVYVCTDRRGQLIGPQGYYQKLRELLLIDSNGNLIGNHSKITGDYEQDIAEFKRLLTLVMDHAMGQFKHHTLMKYIDVSFFTYGLHRGAQDDLDAHAIAFNNRITRFSTRLAEIDEPKLSEWYQDKIIPFHEAHHIIANKVRMALYRETDPEEREVLEALVEAIDNDEDFYTGTMMPREIVLEHTVDEGDGVFTKRETTFKYTPFGYLLDKYADMSPKSGLRKDIARGGIPLGMASDALWKIDLFNLRYVYHMRSKLTKANPELRKAMEMLADQIEEHIPVFGEHFRHVLTDTGSWEHTNRVRTVTKEEYEALMRMKGAHCAGEEGMNGGGEDEEV